MNSEGIILSEISQRKIFYDIITYTWNLKKLTTEKQSSDYGEQGKWEKIVKGYKLPIIRLAHWRDLIYSLVIIANNTVLYT